jgi:acetyltransferase-like isoleucine patch superfamily enzyme
MIKVSAKGLISVLITLVPVRQMRIWLLNRIPGYRVSYGSYVGLFNYISSGNILMQNAQIGSFNWIDTKDLVMNQGSAIRRFNRFKHLNMLHLDELALIQSHNGIFAPEKKAKYHEVAFDFSSQNLFLGRRSELLRKNYVDLTRSLTIGNNVVVGGNGSEFWTHGYDINRNIIVGAIVIGDDIFIGSGCIFSPSAKIASSITIAPGSVIYKELNMKGMYTSHNLYKKK